LRKDMENPPAIEKMTEPEPPDPRPKSLWRYN
jgi:hypothetical protein